MLKDIPKPEVQHVTLAVTLEKNNLLQDEWKVYLVNNNDVAIENTLVASTGYGQKNGSEQKTSTLRHFLETVAPKSGALVEPIDASVLHLNNEYWVSYYIGKDLYDKRFVFLPDTICADNLTFIPSLKTLGVLHS